MSQMTIEPKITNRKTNEECYQRGVSDGIRRCADAIRNKELEAFRMACASEGSGQDEKAMEFRKIAVTLSAIGEEITAIATPQGPIA